MRKYRAVIDTNVLYAGLYSASGASYQVLRRIEAGSIIPYLSTTLVFEYEEVLVRSQKELSLSDRDVEDILDALCNRGEQRQIHFLWRPQLSAPKDDHILELAAACDCADVVTHNVRDFAQATEFGIRVVTPGHLLEEQK